MKKVEFYCDRCGKFCGEHGIGLYDCSIDWQGQYGSDKPWVRQLCQKCTHEVENFMLGRDKEMTARKNNAILHIADQMPYGITIQGAQYCVYCASDTISYEDDYPHPILHKAHCPWKECWQIIREQRENEQK